MRTNPIGRANRESAANKGKKKSTETGGALLRLCRLYRKNTSFFLFSPRSLRSISFFFLITVSCCENHARKNNSSSSNNTTETTIDTFRMNCISFCVSRAVRVGVERRGGHHLAKTSHSCAAHWRRLRPDARNGWSRVASLVVAPALPKTPAPAYTPEFKGVGMGRSFHGMTCVHAKRGGGRGREGSEDSPFLSLFHGEEERRRASTP
jgi:hypothetical protein